MKYNEALDYVDSLQKYGMVPGLDSIRRLCERMGNPQEHLKVVHIAGTNGKGSTLAFISTILKCAGFKVGCYISPVIFNYREHIQIGGRPITRDALCEGLELIKDICIQVTGEGYSHPTLFEVETALAFWYFQKCQCDIVVLETGMGGREDATNIVTDTLCAVLTSISMDHMQYLGNTISAIAKEKAGIIKENCYVITIRQLPEAMEILEKEVAVKNCVWITADRDTAKGIRYGVGKQRFSYGIWKDLEISLSGKHQIENAVLAIETVKALEKAGFSVSETALRKGLKETEWMGRFTAVAKHPLFIVDGAHNEDAARKLVESIEFYFTNKRIIYIIGMLKDKDYQEILRLTHRYAEQIITVTPPNNPRALHAYELAREAAMLHSQVTAVDSLEEAVEMSYLLAGKEDVIMAFGSLSYLGKLISIIKGRNARMKRK